MPFLNIWSICSTLHVEHQPKQLALLWASIWKRVSKAGTLSSQQHPETPHWPPPVPRLGNTQHPKVTDHPCLPRGSSPKPTATPGLEEAAEKFPRATEAQAQH